MKRYNKIILLLMVLVIVFAFAGCTDGNEGKNNTEELTDEKSITILNNALINIKDRGDSTITVVENIEDMVAGNNENIICSLQQNIENGVNTLKLTMQDSSKEINDGVSKKYATEIGYTFIKEGDTFYMYSKMSNKELTNDSLTSFNEEKVYTKETEKEYKRLLTETANTFDESILNRISNSQFIDTIKPSEITGTKNSNGIVNIKINMSRDLGESTEIYKYDINIKDEKFISCKYTITNITDLGKKIISIDAKVDYKKTKVVVEDKDSYVEYKPDSEN